MSVLRRDILGAGASLMGFSVIASRAAALTQPNPGWVVSEAEALAWHKLKDAKGPALTGNASWLAFMAFLESKLKAYGCVDVHRAPWAFRRMETSLWPDTSKWGLVSHGRPMRLANYAASCGTTGPQGVEAELVVWDPDIRPSVAGKIVIFRPVARPEVREAFSDSDYESMTPFDS